MAKALVVDDSKAVRMILSRILRGLGFEVSQASNGREAMELIDAAPAPVTLILADWNMPEMDGLEATRRIRALGGRAGRVPILALTAGATEADQQRSYAAGMNAHVAKPVGRARLAEVLAPLRG